MAAITGVALRFLIPWLIGGGGRDNLNMWLNFGLFMEQITLICIGLALFNLIPVTPLDGSHIISSILPNEKARKYDMFMAHNGMFIFLGLIFLGNQILPVIIGPPARFLWRLFTGM